MAYVDHISIDGVQYDIRDAEAVSFEQEQTLNDVQQEQARANIGAGSEGDVSDLKSQINGFYISTEQTGDFFDVSPSDGYVIVYANTNVTKGNKNIIEFGASLAVGQTYTINGVDYVRNSDGSITFNGTASGNIYLTLYDGNDIPSGSYTLSGCPARGDGESFAFDADYWQNGSRRNYLLDSGSGDSGDLPDGYSRLLIQFVIPKNTHIDGTLYPQFERGTKTAYVKCANQSVPANERIDIDSAFTLFSSSRFTLTLLKNGVDEALGRLSDAEDDIDDIQDDVTTINGNIVNIEGELEQAQIDTLKPFPQNSLTAAQMVTFTDGAEQMPVPSMVVNLDYSATARAKLRAFVSSQNMFNLDDVVTKEHITKNSDGSISPQINAATSIYTGKYGETTAVPAGDMDRLPFLPAGTYYITGQTTGNIKVGTVNPSTGEVTLVTIISATHSFTLANDSLITIIITSSISNIMLSTAPELYTGNSGKTYVVPFADSEGNAFTMYGGTVDLVNGVATELYDSTGNELVTPIVHNIEPVVVKTCLGYNHIWSDCTSVSITYRADVKMYVDQRNKSDALEQYNIDASTFGNVRSDIFLLPGTNVISVAHRGLSHSAPENTMPAFKAAAEAGFLVVETDVDWTSDGVPVLIHDSTINRTARNADGTEISSTISIRDITYAQALEYDFGIWKGDEFAGTKIPTFDEFILFCKRAGLCPQIELKYNQQTQEQTNALIQKVISHGMINRVSWVSNFKDLLLQVLSVHQGAFVVLIGSNESRYNDVLAIKAQYPAVNTMLTCGIDYMTSEEMAAMITRLKAAMIPMGIWTIDNSATIKSLDPYITAITSNMLNAATVLREAALE